MKSGIWAMLAAVLVLSMLLSCGVAKSANLTALAVLVQLRDGTSNTVADVPLNTSRTMYEGDGILVDNYGKGRMTFAGCTVDIYWGSVLVLDPSSAPGCVITLEQGSIEVTVDKGESATVNAGWLTITSLGTQFFVHVDPTQQLVWVIAQEGSVQVTGASKTVILNPQQQTWALQGQPPVDPQPARRDLVRDQKLFAPLENLTRYGPPGEQRSDIMDAQLLPRQ